MALIKLDTHLWENIKKNQRLKIALLSTCVVFLVCHGFAMFNIFYSHDSISGITGFPWNYAVALGRFTQAILEKLLTVNLDTNFICGLWGMLFIGLAVYLVSELLDFKGWQIFATAVFMGSNITEIALFGTYANAVSMYGAAVLLFALAVFLEEKISNKKIGFIASIIVTALALGQYQAYIGIEIGLFILVLLKKIFNNSCTWAEFFKKIITYLLIIGIGGVLYIILMKLASAVTGIALSSGYNGPGSIKNLKIRTMIDTIPQVYQRVRDYFFLNTPYLKNRIRLINIALSIIMGISFIDVISKGSTKNKLYSLLQSGILLVLLPLGLGCVELLSMGAIHQLMLYPYNLIYILLILIVGTCAKIEVQNHSDNITYGGSKAGILASYLSKVMILFTVIGCLCICCYNATYATGYYVVKKFIYDKTVTNMNSIVKDIYEIPEFDRSTTRVEFIGSAQLSMMSYNSGLNAEYYDITGWATSSITYTSVLEMFSSYIDGDALLIDENKPELLEDDFVKNMPCYPKEGYCTYYKGMVIVKLS